jgi:hypothetical protein
VYQFEDDPLVGLAIPSHMTHPGGSLVPKYATIDPGGVSIAILLLEYLDII